MIISWIFMPKCDNKLSLCCFFFIFILAHPVCIKYSRNTKTTPDAFSNRKFWIFYAKNPCYIMMYNYCIFFFIRNRNKPEKEKVSYDKEWSSVNNYASCLLNSKVSDIDLWSVFDCIMFFFSYYFILLSRNHSIVRKLNVTFTLIKWFY